MSKKTTNLKKMNYFSTFISSRISDYSFFYQCWMMVGKLISFDCSFSNYQSTGNFKNWYTLQANPLAPMISITKCTIKFWIIDFQF